MKKQILTLLLCLPLLGIAQGWEKTFSGNGYATGRSVVQTTDGGYIMVGENSDMFSLDVYLLKTNSNGIEQWSQTFSGNGYAQAYSVSQTIDGGYILTGKTSIDDYNHKLYLLKTDANGIEEWSQTFLGNFNAVGNSVEQTSDGGYIITGKDIGLYLLKTDANGIEEWSYNFMGNYTAVGSLVSQTLDGGYIIAGSTSGSSSSNDELYLLKTDANGVEEWSQTYDGNYKAWGASVFKTIDGGYIVTGTTSSFVGYPQKLYLLKTDANGIEEWSQTFSGNADMCRGFSVCQSIDGGYIVAGYIYNTPSQFKLYLLKTNASGIEVWSKAFSGNGSSLGFEVEQTTDGGYIICGYTESFGGGDSELYLIKTDGNGYVTSSFTIPLSTEKGKLQKITNFLGQETKPTKNTPLLYQYENGTVEREIIIE